jgi:Dyp-type peroxidase family
METLEYDDMQGLLIRGYKSLPTSTFLLCHAANRQALKSFLKWIAPKITNGHTDPESHALNIALTKEGVNLLDLSFKSDFSLEFKDGMTSPFRQRILGDYNANAPEYWDWGKPEDTATHFVLMLYARDAENLASKFQDLFAQLASLGIQVCLSLPSQKLPNNKEHFGFHDGISQPTLREMKFKKADNENNVVASGEFIFGYLNEYNKLPLSPMLADDFDLGKNGTYMVFRQIKQDVRGFWNYMMQKSENKIPEAIQLASAMIGRHPTGTPLTLSPTQDHKEKKLSEANHFGYYHNDQSGLKCPVGSHIRKANPRDGMNDDPVESVMVAKRHRILRRGRPYGEPLAPTVDPEDLILSEKNYDAGLYFICFNTNIGRQFEFIQQQWMNNKKFDHLYNDPDPIIGIDSKPPANGVSKPDQLGEFTVQACPVRRKLTDVPQFTYVKGGVYFFMPGIKALNKLAES